MLDEFLAGLIPQMIERGRVLTESIPRNLPRDYDALRTTCKQRIDTSILKLGTLKNHKCKPEHHREFKRIVAEMDLIETVGIAALNRASDSDHQLNILIDKIVREINYPRLTPVVTTLSQNYFCIYPSLNLMCIPLIEGRFLLHLPDLYHELAHPFFTEKNDPLLELFQNQYKDALIYVLSHFEEEKEKAEDRHGPDFCDLLNTWQSSWIKFWIEEFFCDLYGVYTLGPAFVWSHLHLAIKRGSNPYKLTFLQITSHPCDHSRMIAMLYALNLLGFQDAADKIEWRWNEFLEEISAKMEPEYHRCYPNHLINIIADYAWNAVKEIKTRIVAPSVDEPVHNLLNQAWNQFWKDPSGYVEWEKQEVQTLLSNCDR